jgi:GDPmannose 4,6-dehydratase
VFGMMKGQHNPRAELLRDEFPYVEIVPGDLTDLTSLVTAIEQVQPDEFYNLGAISFVAMSFNQAELTANVTGLGVLRALEAVRIVGGAQNNPIRFYQASSSEMFGKVREVPQTDDPVPSTVTVWRCQGVWSQHHHELSRELWAVCVLRNFV